MGHQCCREEPAHVVADHPLVAIDSSEADAELDHAAVAAATVDAAVCSQPTAALCEANVQSLGQQPGGEATEFGSTDGGGSGGSSTIGGASSCSLQEPWRPASYFDREAHEIAGLAELADQDGLRPPVAFRKGAVYHGEWKGQRRHGFGVQTWPDGAKYEGQWGENKADGQGCFTHSNGDRYTGFWSLGAAHGRGVLRSKKGLTYSGDWCHDLQEGFGVEVWDHTGAKYEGRFTSGRKEGEGVYHWPDGSRYVGTWDGGCIDGAGVYIGVDGRWFRGRWEDSVMHGCGMYAWQDGKEFCGQYRCDKKDGFGIFTWPDGRRYIGFWQQNRQHGYGTYCTKNGLSKTAMWSEGKRADVVATDPNEPCAQATASTDSRKSGRRGTTWVPSCQPRNTLKDRRRSFSFEANAVLEDNDSSTRCQE